MTTSATAAEPAVKTEDKNQQGGIEQLLQAKGETRAPAKVVREARLQDYEAEYARSTQDPEGFWSEVARELEWFSPWKRVFNWTYPTFEWFAGAQCNITYNC